MSVGGTTVSACQGVTSALTSKPVTERFLSFFFFFLENIALLVDIRGDVFNFF